MKWRGKGRGQRWGDVTGLGQRYGHERSKRRERGQRRDHVTGRGNKEGHMKGQVRAVVT